MQIINKREDWSFFNITEDLSNTAEQAQKLFVQAIQNIAEAPAASRLADESLKNAIIFSEKLATKQADLLFNIKAENHGFARGCLGCKIDPRQINKPEYIEKMASLFGFVTIPVNWGRIEPARGNYNFSTLDSCVKALGKHKLAIGAGPLLRFSKEYLPKWLLDGKVGFEKIREAA